MTCSGAFNTSCSLTPSAKTGACARSSVIEMAGKTSIRMQPTTNRPRPSPGTTVESERRRQTVQASTEPQAIRRQTRLSVSSTQKKVDHKGMEVSRVPASCKLPVHQNVGRKKSRTVKRYRPSVGFVNNPGFEFAHGPLRSLLSQWHHTHRDVLLRNSDFLFRNRTRPIPDRKKNSAEPANIILRRMIDFQFHNALQFGQDLSG